MSKVKKLNADQEKQITAALTKVADLVREGNSPDDAIVKVAAEKKLPAGYVRLMTNAYNTGQSLGNIRNGATLSEKAGAFPLANAMNVLERLFPSDVKTAAQLQHEDIVSDDYALPPTYWMKRRDAHEKSANIKKVQDNIAAGMGPEEAVRAAYPEYTDKQVAMAVSQLAGSQEKSANIKKVQDNIAAGMAPEAAVRAAYPEYTDEQVTEAVSQLASSQEKSANLKKIQDNIAAGMPPKDAVRAAYPEYTDEQVAEAVAQLSAPKAAAYPGIADKPGRKAVNKIRKLRKEAEQKRLDTIAAGYRVTDSINDLTNYFRKVGHVPLDTVKKNCEVVLGERAGNVLDKAAAQAGKLSKTAAHHNPDHIVDWEAAPYCLVKEALNAVDAYVSAKDIMDNFEKEAEADAVEIARPFCQAADQSAITGSVWDHQLQKQSSSAMPFVLGYGSSQFMNPIAKQIFPPKEDQIAGLKSQLETPEHSNKIQAIRTRAMLDDLMANDPVISGYEHDEVLQAFNHLSELAPNALTTSNMLTKSLMRKYLEQGQMLDTFDIDQLLGAENKLNQSAGRNMSAAQYPKN